MLRALGAESVSTYVSWGRAAALPPLYRRTAGPEFDKSSKKFCFFRAPDLCLAPGSGSVSDKSGGHLPKGCSRRSHHPLHSIPPEQIDRGALGYNDALPLTTTSDLYFAVD
jgi:hypothetical protein